MTKIMLAKGNKKRSPRKIHQRNTITPHILPKQNPGAITKQPLSTLGDEILVGDNIFLEARPQGDRISMREVPNSPHSN